MNLARVRLFIRMEKLCVLQQQAGTRAFLNHFVSHEGGTVLRGHTTSIYDAIHLCIHMHYHFRLIRSRAIIDQLLARSFTPDALRDIYSDMSAVLALYGINLYILGEDSLITRGDGIDNHLIRIMRVNNKYYVPVAQFGRDTDVNKFVYAWQKQGVDYRIVSILDEFERDCAKQLHVIEIEEQIANDEQLARSLSY